MADSPADTVNRAIVETRAALVRLSTALRAQFTALRTEKASGLERGATNLAESFANQDIDAMCRRLNELQGCSDLIAARMRGAHVEREAARLHHDPNDSEKKPT